MTVKKFFFAPSWSVFDTTLLITFMYKEDLFGKRVAFFVGYLLFLYIIFLAVKVRKWGLK